MAVVVVLVVVEVAEIHVLLASLYLYLFEFFRNYAKVCNKGLHGEEQNKFSKKSYRQWKLNMGPLVFYLIPS